MIDDFKALIERAGFKFEKGEFENLIKWYFRNKESITLEEFKLFATGKCVKLQDTKPKIPPPQPAEIGREHD